jgi:hypothetical protein
MLTDSTLRPGTYTYWIQADNAICSSPSRVAAVLRIDSLPTTPNCLPLSPICSGSSAQIIGAGSIGASSYSFWNDSIAGVRITTRSAPAGIVRGNICSIVTTMPTGIYNYFVQGDYNACRSARQMITVEIDSSPTTPTCVIPPYICEGSSSIIIGAGGGPSASYSFWTSSTSDTLVSPTTFPSGQVIGDSLLIADTTSAGFYTYYVQADLGHCHSARQSVLQIIRSTPGTLPTPLPDTICFGTTAVITPSGSTGALGYRFWTSDTGSARITPSSYPPGTTTRAELTIPDTLSPGNYIYYISGQNSYCTSLARTPYVVEVLEVPTTPNCTAPAAICAGDSTIVVGTGSSGAASYSFWTAASGGSRISRFSFPPGRVIQDTLYIPSTLSAGSYVYYVQADNANCSSNSRQAITVRINASPGRPNCLAPPTTCAGGTVSIRGAGSSSASAYTFWTSASGGSRISSGTTPPGSTTDSTCSTPSSLSPGSYVYYVQGENTQCSGKLRQAVTVIIDTTVVPTVSLYARPDSIGLGSGDPITLVTDATNAGPTPSFQWYKNGSIISGATSASYGPFTGVDGDVYYCIMNSTAPCPSPHSVRSNYTRIRVNASSGSVDTLYFGARASSYIELASWSIPRPAPRGYVVKVNLVDSFSNISTGSIPTANRTYSGAGEQVVYNDRPNGPVTVLGLLPSTRYFFKVFPYSCANKTYVNKGGTYNSASAKTTGGVGIDNVDAFSDLLLYPNPNNGAFTISGNQPIKSVAIYSVEGKLLFEKTIGANEISLNIEMLSGLYLIEITRENGTIVKKLNITH